MPVLAISSKSSRPRKPSWATNMDMVNPIPASSDTPEIWVNHHKN